MATVQKRKLSVLSTEYVWARITDITGKDISTVTIQLAAIPSTQTQPGPTDWKTPSATNSPSASVLRAALLIGPGTGGLALAKGQYNLWYKIIDTPEVPVALDNSFQVV